MGLLLCLGWCTQAQCKDCVSLKAVKASFFSNHVFLSLTLFLPLAGATWAPDRWGSCFHCYLYREGAAQEEKEEIQSLGSAVLIYWFHLPGGFYLFKSLHSVPTGPWMYCRSKGDSHFSWLLAGGYSLNAGGLWLLWIWDTTDSDDKFLMLCLLYDLAESFCP